MVAEILNSSTVICQQNFKGHSVIAERVFRIHQVTKKMLQITEIYAKESIGYALKCWS